MGPLGWPQVLSRRDRRVQRAVCQDTGEGCGNDPGVIWC
jgi:hypothetical protein